MTIERKEIIQINGTTILVAMTLIANFLVVGFMHRFHNYQLFVEEKAHSELMTDLRAKQEHNLKNEIVALEGVSNWLETDYVKSRSQ
jgi:hypothetical protein